ncbi:hypothetical protein KCP78_04015 [Salmonella enterica subsp. enterica]|nr:hypothetical protein KCP78_04015 [Salmonella enterica subsp. enterica]
MTEFVNLTLRWSKVLPVFVRDVELELSVAISDIDNKIVGHPYDLFPVLILVNKP